MKQQIKKWWARNFSVISIKQANEWGLIHIFNIYGDSVNHLNCRSIWTDLKAREYRVTELFELQVNNKLSAVDYLVKEFSAIFGSIKTEPMTDLLLVGAINQAKKIENESRNKFIDEVQLEIRKVISNTHYYQGSLAFTELLLELELLKSKQ